jgi:hypothetical protein
MSEGGWSGTRRDFSRWGECIASRASHAVTSREPYHPPTAEPLYARLLTQPPERLEAACIIMSYQFVLHHGCSRPGFRRTVGSRVGVEGRQRKRQRQMTSLDAMSGGHGHVSEEGIVSRRG